MNKAEKAITKAQLKLEERALKELKKSYENARKDLEKQISMLDARSDMQNLQSIIYQKKYQEALLKQVEGVLDDLNKGQYKTLQEFFEGSYNNGYIGMMYNLQNEGIPLTVPVDPKKVVRAVQTDSKLSASYYQDRILPENLSVLKRRIRTELTRGIASGKNWKEVAYQLAHGMNSPINRAMNDAIRIARTEGNRINQQGRLDSGQEAVDLGVDLVKQWDSTLDGLTRPDHRKADGQIVEWDEDFVVGGEKLKAPSCGGSAKNVCNCRCQLLEKPRRMLDEDELKELQKRANFFGLDKTKDFEEYKKKYLQLPKKPKAVVQQNIDIRSTTKNLEQVMEQQDYDEYCRIVSNNPLIAKAYKYADDMKYECFSGGGCCYSYLIEFGYPSESYVQSGMSRYHTISHEFGHFIDTFGRKSTHYDLGSLTWSEMDAIEKGVGARYTSWITPHFLSNSDQFLSALRKDMKKIIDDGDIRLYCLSNGRRNITCAIQDAVDGWGIGRIAWGHGDKYYNRAYNNLKDWERYSSVKPVNDLKSVYISLGFDASNQAKVKKIVRQYETASELWANIISAETTGGGELETVKEKFPESYKAMKEIMKGVK